MLKLNKEDSRDLGFALMCFEVNAITKKEFQIWLDEIVKKLPVDEFPIYLIDLIDFLNSDDSLLHIYDVIGFVPGGDLSTQDKNAIYGITYMRQQEFYDIPVSKEKALAALKKNPQILQEFKRFFPFVKLESE